MVRDWKHYVRPNVASLFERLRAINERCTPHAEPAVDEKELRATLKRLAANDPVIRAEKKKLKEMERALVDMMMSGAK
jgi:hypothetical protein